MWLYTTGLHGREFVGKNWQEQTETEKAARWGKNIDHACMHVRGGAGILHEPQLTQTQKKHGSIANTQSWDSCAGTASLVSARAFLQNIGHWLAVRKESGILLFPRRTTHPEVPVSARRTITGAPCHLSVSWTAFHLEMIGKHFHPIKSHSQKIKQPCFAELLVPIKPPAHTHKPNPALEHEFICNLWRL